jgi:hypothetical protein
MEIVTLWIEEFDNLENHNPYSRREIGTFGPKDNLTAHGNCDKFLKTMPPVKMYLGWDHQIYPKFVMEYKTLK